jgi:hypothetical protein
LLLAAAVVAATAAVVALEDIGMDLLPLLRKDTLLLLALAEMVMWAMPKAVAMA